MRQTDRIMVCLSIILTLTCLSFIATAQDDIVRIESTGLPAVATQEELLPQGAVAHLRANNLELLLQNIDSFLTSFVPEKAVPPEFQPFLDSSHPFLAFLTTQMFGQEMQVNALSAMLGIALNKPVSLSFYPMDPQQGFVLSVPIADPQGFTGSVQNILRPVELTLESDEGLNYYYLEPGVPNMPEEIFLLTSDTMAFFCGSEQVAQMLVNRSVDKLAENPLHSKGLEKYAENDLVLLLSPAFIKPQIPMMKDSFRGALEPFYQQLRGLIAEIPPGQRILIDMRLRWELGIDSLEQLLNFAEAYSSAFYQVSLDWGARWLQELEGLALAIDLEQTIQQASVTLYSQGVKTEDFTAPLPATELKKALVALPGSKFAVNIEGQAPPNLPSRFLQDVLFAAERELKQRGLPLQAFSALKNFIAEQQLISPLEFKTPWSISTILKTTEAIAWEESKTLPELFTLMLELPSSMPLFMTVKMMPETDIEQLKAYFAEKADLKNANARALLGFREQLPVKPPFFDSSSEFSSQDFDNGATALVFENIHTTRRGYFGYQRHALINRRIILAETQNGYTYLYDWLPDEEIQNALMQAEPEALSPTILELLELVPADANSVKMLKTLPALPNALYVLTMLEHIAFQELDQFLKQANEILTDVDDDKVEEALLEAGIDIPVLVLRLKRDESGKLYCVLPGGLHYPRPSAMTIIQALLKDFSEGLDQVGGSLAYTAVRSGELESTILQRSDALALLVKTLGNNVFEKYLSTPDGMNLLLSQLMHPKDRVIGADTLLFTNALWENIREMLEDSGEHELYELADLLAPSEDEEEALEEFEESEVPGATDESNAE